MDFQAKFYDKVLMLHLAGVVTAADAMELEMLTSQSAGKAASLLICLESATLDATAAEAMKTFRSQCTKKQTGPTKCLLISPTLPDADHKNLVDALDALKTQDALRIVDFFAKEKIFKDLKARTNEEHKRAFELLAVNPENPDSFAPTLEKLKSKLEALENEFRVISRDIADLEDQRKKSRKAAASTPKTNPDDIAKLNALKDHMAKILHSMGVLAK